MMFTSSDASSLVRELWWWEHAEYVFGALVAAACAGEYIADFNKRPWVKAHKDRIAKISTLVLVAALVFELICITRANGKSDEVIGKLRDEAEAADKLAQSAVQNSNAALGTSATALTKSANAITDSSTALSQAKDALNKTGLAEAQLTVLQEQIIEMGPRKQLLSGPRGEAIVNALKQFHGQRVAIADGRSGWIYPSTDQEVLDTITALKRLVSEANWDVQPAERSMLATVPGPGKGIWVSVSACASPRTVLAANALVKALGIVPVMAERHGFSYVLEPDDQVFVSVLTNPQQSSHNRPTRFPAAILSQ